MEKRNRPVLSISLLASNRKETTKKCLDSLKMIMDEVESELIIVDTGCDEEMKALLHEYTDEVIPFTWCADFSKARNAGLKRCRGEWFLYIDDDEWFEDVTEIVDFFRTGEYKEYGLACYIQRNYMDRAGMRYHDSWVSRMIRLDPDTRFESSIHEYLYPVKGKNKLLHSPAKHFGYIFNSDEERYNHSRRNISLLLEMMEKERGNLRWWVQLAQEYSGIREYTKLYELCKEGIAFFKDRDDQEANKERGAFYCGCLKASLSRYRYEEARKDYETAIADARNTKPCRMQLYSFGAELYLKMGYLKKSENCCRKYLALYEELLGNEEAILSGSAFFVRDAFEMETRNNIYCFLISLRLKQNDTTALKQLFYKIGWDEPILSLYSSLIPDVLTAFSQMEYDEDFAGMAQKLISRKGPDLKTIEWIQNAEKEMKKPENGCADESQETKAADTEPPETEAVATKPPSTASTAKKEEFYRLVRIFAQVDSPHYYIWYLKILYADTVNDRELLQTAYGKLFSCVVDIFQLDDSVWEIAGKYQVDLEPLFLGIPYDTWAAGVDAYVKHTDLDNIRHRREIVTACRKQDNIRYGYFFLKTAEAELVYGGKREDYAGLREQLAAYTEKTVSFYREFFKDSAFGGDMEMLPPPCRLAVKLHGLMGKEETIPIKSLISEYEECIGVYPPLDAALKEYVKLMGNREKERLVSALKEKTEQAQTQNQLSQEMEQLTENIKKRIIYLAEQGLMPEAADAMRQLRKLRPDEKELEELEKMLY